MASRWQQNKDIADTFLRSRSLRRKLLLYLCSFVVAMMGLGIFFLSKWLGGSPWLFLTYWAICAAGTAFMSLLAIYDMLAVIREERQKAWDDSKGD